MNLGNVLNWANAILLEGFKDDVLNGYKKLGYDTEDNRLLTAIKTLNSENQIKELIKKEVGKVPNVGLAVAKKYTPEEFIDFVSKAHQNLGLKQQQQREKEERKQKASSASEDYYIYPCRTFEEAHNAAFSHIGNLKRMTREERENFFKNEYGIDIPKPSTHFKTKKTPEQMLEFMKECPVFMEPTWCVCGGENFWNIYKLEASNDEDANCFIIISKTHPNVRFCITKDTRNIRTVEGDYVIMKKDLGEFRDIWQIGGGDVRETGMEIAKLAFGDITGLLNNILKKGKKVPFEEITDGNQLFRENEEMTSFNKNLIALTDGEHMFYGCDNLTTFTSELPSLTNGASMFSGCSKLKSFTSKLPKLTDGTSMFWGCNNLTSFVSELPKLTNGYYMVNNCSKLSSFTSDLPSLTNGEHMFSYCENLTSFTSNLPKLTNGNMMFRNCPLTTFTSELPKLTNGIDMFRGCFNLASFTSELPSLTDGWGMFKGCKLDKQSVINILTSIPNANNERIDIGAGYDYTKDEDTLRAIEEAKNKKWKVFIEFNG